MKLSLSYASRIPNEATTVLVVSNHRSFLDAPILIQALGRPIRIACHYYMGQTPLLREMVQLLGCFPLQKRQADFFAEAGNFLKMQQWVGLFPEGGSPMVELTQPWEMGTFQRGFAHLALRVGIPNLAILPVAIAATEESTYSTFPIQFLRLFDPSEPLFDRPGLHPVVIYHHVKVLIGHPMWITPQQQQQYQGKQAKRVVTEVTQYCQQQITDLLDSTHYACSFSA
jgi:1-acyl-sn-glycerol-3-phosphate acyltransferase